MQTLESFAEHRYFPCNLRIGSPLTRAQYAIAFRHYDLFLGRPATIADLDDDRIAGFTRWLADVRRVSPKTANERAGRIVAMWQWMARRRIVDSFPLYQRLRVPHRTPRSWTIDELAKLYSACDKVKNVICGNVGANWWRALLATAWNTGERITALLSAEWPDLSPPSLHVRAETRKANAADEVYTLWPETVELIDRLTRDNLRIFEYASGRSALYHQFATILRHAELPNTRYTKFHAIRVSHATWVQVSGGNASHALRHASPAVTQRHYIDPRVAKIPPADLPRGFLKK